MPSDRTLWAAVGICLLAVAAVVLVSPAAEALIPTAAFVGRLGNDYLLVAVLAAFAAVATVTLLGVRAVTGVSEAKPPAVESTDPRVPGGELDDALDEVPPVRVTPTHRRIHRRLRTEAVALLAESTDRSTDDARESVARGTWTDDPTAAAFLAESSLDPPSVLRRVGCWLRRRNWFQRRVEATVGSLEAVSEGSP